ncbi:hypothetical protein [Chitinophaga sp. HK235]|uniref:hypothetical protein n=1 Tax=Chitinophaga sp. HK235 TaxID=2952571 RepID=UPI001BAB0C8C|nr:hypothetical protein [Chitinophaga sp. HK235]
MHPYSEWTVIVVFLVIEAALLVKYGGKVLETFHQYQEGDVRGMTLAFRVIVFILLLAVFVLLDLTLWGKGQEG